MCIITPTTNYVVIIIAYRKSILYNNINIAGEFHIIVVHECTITINDSCICYCDYCCANYNRNSIYDCEKHNKEQTTCEASVKYYSRRSAK